LDVSWYWLLWILGSYLLGSLSPGDLVAKLLGVDIRALGTGNPGTTNVWREVGRRWGVLVFLLDFTSGAAATVPLNFLASDPWLRLGATGAVLAGHIFPVFWRFRGGAGGALGMGCALGLLPLGALFGALVTVALLVLTRTPIYSVWVFFGVALVIGGLIHRDLWGVAGTLLAMLAPTVSFFFRQRIRSVDDLRRALGI
jgi:glycerol-3-phosphate acyltransferase PlsY